MPWIERKDGYHYGDGKLKIHSSGNVFGLFNIVRKLSGMCWSVAHIASHLKIPQSQVKRLLNK